MSLPTIFEVIKAKFLSSLQGTNDQLSLKSLLDFNTLIWNLTVGLAKAYLKSSCLMRFKIFAESFRAVCLRTGMSLRKSITRTVVPVPCEAEQELEKVTNGKERKFDLTYLTSLPVASNCNCVPTVSPSTRVVI